MENSGVIAAVTMVIGAILVVIVISIMPTMTETAPGMAYDDYVEAEGAISAGGSIELVEVGGKTYAHAADVGDGYYKLEDGREVHLTVGKAKLDIVVAMGQSNNRYTCWNIAEASAIPDMGTAYYWGTLYEPVTNPNVEGEMLELRDPETGTVRLGDKVPVFCAHWTKETGHKVFYVITAVGGSSITSWIPGEQQYQRQIRILNQATAAIDSDRFDWTTSCCTWIQGEEDHAMSLDDYLGYMGQMLDGLFDDSYPYRLNYMVMATPRLGTAVEADKIVAGERDNVRLATDIATTFTKDNGLLGPDNTHWTQQGDNLVAEALAKTAAEEQGGDSGVIGILLALMAAVAVIGGVIGWRRYNG